METKELKSFLEDLKLFKSVEIDTTVDNIEISVEIDFTKLKAEIPFWIKIFITDKMIERIYLPLIEKMLTRVTKKKVEIFKVVWRNDFSKEIHKLVEITHTGEKEPGETWNWDKK